MEKSFQKMLDGYQLFRKKYAGGDESIMQQLSLYGQKPEIMVIACCDSRVDPALILNCGPGELFVVRNVANIVPPCAADHPHTGTSAALEFAVQVLNVKHLVLLGHSQCGGIQALLDSKTSDNDDFITRWVSLIKADHFDYDNPDECAKLALNQSYQNCLTFPWISEKVKNGELIIHSWFFDIKTGQIFSYLAEHEAYAPLGSKILAGC